MNPVHWKQEVWEGLVVFLLTVHNATDNIQLAECSFAISTDEGKTWNTQEKNAAVCGVDVLKHIPVPILITLLAAATGAIAYFSFGGPNTLAAIKRIWGAVGKGALILLFSWLFLNFLLGVLGFDVNVFGRWTTLQP